jgi:hypothetical protein
VARIGRVMQSVVAPAVALAVGAACGGSPGEPTPSLTGCTSGSIAPATMAVGEVRAGLSGGGVSLDGTTGGADYTLIGFNCAATGGQTATVTLTASGVAAPASTPNPVLIPGDQGLRAVQQGGAIEQQLRATEQRDLSPLIRVGGSGVAAPGQDPSIASTLVPGQLIQLNVNYQQSCTNPRMQEGRVVLLSTHAIIVSDVTNPAGGFTDEEYAAIGATFDTLVYPVVTEHFGAPTDIDGNNRVLVFFTRTVNELTPAGSDAIIGGFQFGRDLFPLTATSQVQGCAASNVGEMFYMLVPDPAGVVNGNIRTKTSVRQLTAGTLAHEFQHLINAGRRLHVNRATVFEELWLNEGLSHIAEELVFYRASALAPRQNLASPDFTSAFPRRIPAFNEFQLSNFGRLRSFLERPSANSPYAPNDSLATRGATWSFLRYAVDQRSGSEQTVWHALVRDTRLAGMNNLRQVLDGDLPTLFRDWAVATYTDDAVGGIAARFSHPSWNYRSIFTRLGESRLPLEVRTISAAGAQSVTLDAGGSAYFKLGVPPNTRATIQWTGGQSVAVSVVRVR